MLGHGRHRVLTEMVSVWLVGLIALPLWFVFLWGRGFCVCVFDMQHYRSSLYWWMILGLFCIFNVFDHGGQKSLPSLLVGVQISTSLSLSHNVQTETLPVLQKAWSLNHGKLWSCSCLRFKYSLLLSWQATGESPAVGVSFYTQTLDVHWNSHGLSLLNPESSNNMISDHRQYFLSWHGISSVAVKPCAPVRHCQF